LNDLRKQGYLPQAVLNYLARLSHAYESQALMSFDELAKHFNLEKLSRASARFDKNQLLYWQKEAVMALSADAVWEWLGEETKETIPESLQDIFMDAIRPNICFPIEAKNWSAILFENNLQFTDEQIAILKEAGEAFFTTLQSAVEKHGADLKNILDELKHKLNVSGKKLFMPVRLALTAQQHGPELFQIVELLGREKMEQRFENALELVRDN
jgi:glutamyl-tRNA synthetase